MTRPWPCLAAALAALCCGPVGSGWSAAAEAGDPFGVVPLPTLELRREYNDVAAAIDTMVRTYGQRQVESVARRDRDLVRLPPGAGVVLLFWADDEARVFLNGNLVGSTRLTPTRIDIPTLYLEAQNRLEAHCWDTDRVESGFMAGLYVEDAAGLLHPVLTTSEERWEGADGGRAQEIFYTHSQPDIPAAQVMWGERLFGQVQMGASFTATEVLGALGRPPASATAADWAEEPMHFHEVVSRLVDLEARQREIAAVLAASRDRGGEHLRYRGSGHAGLSFTLGRAAPLAEAGNVSLAADLAAWVRRLPVQERQLVLREARPLKGVAAATPDAAFEAVAGERQDRRRDYRPPPERGPVAARRPVSAAGAVARAAAQRLRWWLWLGALGLGAYVAAGAGQWWRVYNSQRWGPE